MQSGSTSLLTSDDLRFCVFKIVNKTASHIFGHAFGLTPHMAITCRHVVENLPLDTMEIVQGRNTVIKIKKITYSDNPAIDLALLHTEEAIACVFPVTIKSQYPDMLLSRIYFSTDPDDASQVQFHARGRRDLAVNNHWNPDAYEFRGDFTARGCSGAPIYDPACGAIVGVFTAGEDDMITREPGRRWATSFDIASQWPELQKVLDENSQSYPCFGSGVNPAGMAYLCRLQAQDAVDGLTLRQRFDLDWNVPRDAIETSIHEFLASPYPLLALVGESNVGKTCLLAHLSHSQALGPTLLLQAVSLNSFPQEFPQFLHQSIAKVWDDLDIPRGPTLPNIKHFIAAASLLEKPLVIFLDGVNEATDRHHFKDWLASAVGWCEKNKIRLILTCRSGASWNMISLFIPDSKKRLYCPDQNEDNLLKRCLRLSDFSQSEACRAAQNYQVPLKLMEEIGRHPLLFRVARDLRLDDVSSSIGRYQLLKQFVLHHLNEAALRLNHNQNTILWSKLEKIAESLSPDGNMDISKASQILGSDSALDIMIAVNLLIPTGNQVRFWFDQLADVLRPAPDNLLDILHTMKTNWSLAHQHFGNAVAALIKLEGENQEERFLSGLHSLLGVFESFVDEDSLHLYQYGDSLDHLAHSLPIKRQELITKIYCCLRAAVNDSTSAARLAIWLSQAPLPIETRVELLLDIAVWESSYPNRVKDWGLYEMNVEQEQEILHPSSALFKLMREDMEKVRPLLLNRLGDKTRFGKGTRDDEASISSLCGRILFSYREFDTKGLYDAVIHHSDGWSLLNELLRQQPVFATDYAILKLNDISSQLVALSMLNHIPAKHIISHAQSIEAQLQSLLAQENQIGLEAAALLRTLDPQYIPAWKYILSAYENNRLHSSTAAVSLVPIPDKCMDIIYSFILKDLEFGCNLLQQFEGSTEEHDKFVNLLSEIYKVGSEEKKIGYLIESQLYRLKHDARLQPWLTFAVEVARNGSQNGLLRPIIYAVFPPSETPDYQNIRDTILHSPLAGEDIRLILNLSLRENQDNNYVKSLYKTFRIEDKNAADFEIIKLGCQDFQGIKKLLPDFVRFWQSLDQHEHSHFSASVISQLKAGESLEAIFESLLNFLPLK